MTAYDRVRVALVEGDLDTDRWLSAASALDRGAVAVVARPSSNRTPRLGSLVHDLLEALGQIGLGEEASRTGDGGITRQVVPYLLEAGVEDLLIQHAQWLGVQGLSEAVEMATLAGVRLWLVIDDPRPKTVPDFLSGLVPEWAWISRGQLAVAWSAVSGRPPGTAASNAPTRRAADLRAHRNPLGPAVAVAAYLGLSPEDMLACRMGDAAADGSTLAAGSRQTVVPEAMRPFIRTQWIHAALWGASNSSCYFTGAGEELSATTLRAHAKLWASWLASETVAGRSA